MDVEAYYQKLNDAIGAHGAWKQKLRVAILMDQQENLVEKAGDHQNCAFGAWLRSLPASERARPEAEETIRLHQAFHASATKVARQVVGGHKDVAMTLLEGEMSEASKVLTNAVSRWKFALMR
jgi:hypothetical protein